MPRKCGVFVLLSLIAVLFQSTPARALVKFDFEQKYFSEPGEEVLDHFILEQDGVYHLFYLRGDPALNIGHATTTDFIHWQLQPPVLAPGDFDKRLWAPHLFKHPSGNLWMMFYTAVNQYSSQQTAVAFSNDLFNWSKYPYPIYHPDPVWAEWSETYFTHGRDPHVIEYNGTYYLFNTAKTWTNQGAVACATSQDLLHWTDIGPIYVHYTWHVMESIFIMQRNDKFHMFFTEETVNGTSHMSSDSLLSGWDVLANRRIIDLGHAAQVTTLSDGTEIFSRHSIYNDNNGLHMYTIRLDTLRWTGDIPGVYKPWPLAKDWTNVDGFAFALQPTFMNNPSARYEDVDPTFEGQSWIGSKERYNGPLGIGSPGGTLGEQALGTMRSKTFSVQGWSMRMLVGGTNDPVNCYVALVDNSTGEKLLSETGNGVEEMDERIWDLRPFVGRTVYIEVADHSDTGHINVDSIEERADPVGTRWGDGRTNRKPGFASEQQNPGVAKRTLKNVPNPFNPSTTISFELAAAARATLDVFDVNGRFIRRLVDARLASGTHQAPWDGADEHGRPVASGVYFYRLSVDGGVVATRKMALLK